jgi:predicted aminopeptidase
MRTLLWLAVGSVISTPGCGTLGFYRQAVAGHVEVMAKRKPAAKVMEKTDDPFLRERLALTQRLLDFARDELHMPTTGNYESYADLGRNHLVWVVYAAPELSMQPHSWWYPVVGRQDYRGYFREDLARTEAARLEAQGYETWIGPSDAYSTLGWFRDPVLNTFVRRNEADYADLIFHELAHVKTFSRGNTAWNEGLAETVAREGVRRWFLHTGRPHEVRTYEARLRKRAEAKSAISGAAVALRDLYAQPIPDAAKRVEKTRILSRLNHQLRELRWQWGGGLQSWIDGPVNNARLVSFTTYEDEVPRFERLLTDCGGDFQEFWRHVPEIEP